MTVTGFSIENLMGSMAVCLLFFFADRQIQVVVTHLRDPAKWLKVEGRRLNPQNIRLFSFYLPPSAFYLPPPGSLTG
jgi:hypothetical protein